MAENTSQYIHVSEERRDTAVRILKSLIKTGNEKRFSRFLGRIHSADLANLWENFSEAEQNHIINHLDEEDSALFLSELNPDQRSDILEDKTLHWVVDRLKELDPDDSVDILRELSTIKAEKIIKKFDTDYSNKIKDLLKYPEETAGGLMTSDFFAVLEDANVETIIRQFRREAQKNESLNLHFVYVVDNENHFLGYIPLRKLILEKQDKKARDIMKPPVIRVSPEMDQEEVAKIFRNYDLISAPVVDDDNILLGRITVDDIVDVMEAEASEDAYHMFGVHREEKFSNGIFLSLKYRLPWMFVNILTTSLSAIVIGFYKGLIEQFVVIAMFMPMVAALGGAIGNQMVVVIVRGLASGKLHWEIIKWILVRDIMAVILGSLIIGIAVGAVSFFFFDNIILGAVVSSALLLNMVFGTIMGAGIPLFLKLLKLDPAYGSSILLQGSTDIMGFFIFLGLSAEIFL
jgi:magnesium transporter